MTKLFQGKYGTNTTRLHAWDYGTNAAYFITICTKSKIPWFGKVDHGKMHLSEIGKIADACWMEIPRHFPFVELGEYIVMPDHVHGIVIIVEAQNLAPLQSPPPRNQFGPQSKNLASIIRGFKVGVTKQARLVNTDFVWQKRYYDHIIRNTRAYQDISGYIKNNPSNY